MPPYLKPVVVDAQGTVESDVPCISCAYNLRTMHIDGVCPECGTPVGESANGYLVASDENWLKTLRRGMRALTLLPLLMLLGMCIVMAYALQNRAIMMQNNPGFMLYSGLLNLVYMAVWILGVLWLSAPEPDRADLEEGVTARKLLRWVGVYGTLGYVALMLINLLIMYRNGGTWPSGAFGTFQLLLGFVFTAAMMVAPLALIRYLGLLAGRIPAPNLVSYSKVLFWVALLTGMSFVAMQVLSVWSLGGPGGMFGGSTGAITPPANLKVQLTTTQRAALARGSMLTVGPLDPDDPNSAYVVTVGRTTVGPNVPLKPQAAGVKSAFMVVADPGDPNGAVPYVVAGTMPVAPIGKRFMLLTVFSQFAGCFMMLFVVGLYVFMLLIYFNINKIFKAAQEGIPSVNPAPGRPVTPEY